MIDKRLEALSALMDGEADETDAGALGGWSRDEGMRGVWGRYHVISDCLRGNLPRYLDPALTNRISVALRNEPAIVAAPDRAARHAWLKPLVGMAIAASVATLALIGIQMNRTDSAGAQAVAQAPVSHGGSGGQINLALGRDSARVLRPATPMSEANSRLNRYLINHNEQRTNNAVQGMPPYVRIIAEDQDQNF